MTRSSTSANGTVSDMPAKLDKAPVLGKSPETAWLLRAAKRLGYRPQYLKARVFDAQRSWFRMVAVIVEEMMADGHEQLVDRRCLALDLSRSGIDPKTGEHVVATVQAIRADAADNAPLAEHLISPNTDSFLVAERAGLNAVRGMLRFSRSGRRKFPRAK